MGVQSGRLGVVGGHLEQVGCRSSSSEGDEVPDAHGAVHDAVECDVDVSSDGRRALSVSGNGGPVRIHEGHRIPGDVERPPERRPELVRRPDPRGGVFRLYDGVPDE